MAGGGRRRRAAPYTEVLTAYISAPTTSPEEALPPSSSAPWGSGLSCGGTPLPLSCSSCVWCARSSRLCEIVIVVTPLLAHLVTHTHAHAHAHLHVHMHVHTHAHICVGGARVAQKLW